MRTVLPAGIEVRCSDMLVVSIRRPNAVHGEHGVSKQPGFRNPNITPVRQQNPYARRPLFSSRACGQGRFLDLDLCT